MLPRLAPRGGAATPYNSTTGSGGLMPNPYGKWVHDDLAPSGFRWRRHDEQPATQMIPIITPPTAEHGGTVEYAGHQDHALPVVQQEFRQDDGSVYTRVGPEKFDWFGLVDSRTIVDPGAPA